MSPTVASAAGGDAFADVPAVDAALRVEHGFLLAQVLARGGGAAGARDEMRNLHFVPARLDAATPR
jgi:hypothetical protein